jgi:hypothetical protein
MKEIKFRAWENGKMYYQVRCGGMFDGIPTAPTVWNDEQGDWLNLTGQPYTKVMQYTGRELMGQEVYEGDILEDYISGKRYEVVWDDYGMFLYCDVNGNEGIDYYEFEDTASLDFTEVIGNIYKNPELLVKEGVS